MLNETRQILISAPRESVSEYLRDLRRLSEYEQKVEDCEVRHEPDADPVVDVEGRWFGVPWKGSFQMTFTRDGGYTSRMLKGPFTSVTGGFHLRPVLGGTLLTHDERYQVPLAFKLLKPVVRRWLGRSLEKELAVIKEGAEALHRRRVVEQVDEDIRLDKVAA